MRSRFSALDPARLQPPLVLALVIVLYAAWIAWLPGSFGRGVVGMLLTIGLRAAAAAGLLRVAQGQSAPGWQRIWQYLALGIGFWAVADAWDLMVWLRSSSPPQAPSIANWLRMAGHLAAITAVATHPSMPPQRLGRIRDWLDSVIIGLAVLTIAWQVMLRPVLSIGMQDPIAVFWIGLTPALDLVVFSLLIRLLLLSEAAGHMRLFAALASGAFILGISDIGDGYLRLQSEGLLGSMVQVGWMTSTTILLLAPSIVDHPLAVRFSLARLAKLWSRWAQRLEPLLALVFTYAVVGITVADWWLTGEVDWIAVGAAALLSVLLVARQGAILGQTELRTAYEQVALAHQQLAALNQELEAKVQSRTRALEQTVADLGRLNRELQELDRLKSEFVALVSHELRAPLTNILSGIELVLRGKPQLRSSVEQSLVLVREETERLSRFVEAILDLSALEAGRFPIKPLALRLENVAREVSSRFPASFSRTRLVMDFPGDLPAVQADERSLGSVFFHLLDNAFKYAPEGEVRVEVQATDGIVEVAVSDRGPGVPAAERDRIFEMFHRLDNRDSREVYGHGLGLHMTKRLLETMGGGIRVEDGSDGVGAKFVFWLPRAVPEDA